ncbi:MAG: hypothetical protein JSS68_16105 [Actinobacteria bacterium]|nr:hypothetical protein [Actinomycetota bacterium]
MIELEAVPWSMWAYVAATVVSAAILALRVHHSVVGVAGDVVIIAGWDYLLLRRVRWIWIATVALLAAGLAVDIAVETIRWYALVITPLQLILLLLPETRRFFEQREAGT